MPAAEFERAIDAAFRKLAREVKIPGFRPGKAPRRLLEARLGTEVAREQALRDALPEYYAEAVVAEDIDVIAPPEIDITAGEEEGDVEFDAVVEVRPVVDARGLRRAPRRAPEPRRRRRGRRRSRSTRCASASPTSRTRTGRSSTATTREIDIKGYVARRGHRRAHRHRLPLRGRVGLARRRELDEELRGKRPGDILKFTDTLPERFGERAGDEVAFQVLVKEAKRKVLPEPTDEWVSEVSEFETVDELRDDVALAPRPVRARCRRRWLVRDKVLEAAADLVDIEAPEPLVEQEMERRLHDLHHRLEAQGVTIPQYLAATGQDQEAFVAGVRDGADQGGARRPRACARSSPRRGSTATDEEVDAEVDRLAERLGEKPAKVRRDLERRGGSGGGTL